MQVLYDYLTVRLYSVLAVYLLRSIGVARGGDPGGRAPPPPPNQNTTNDKKL